MKLFGSSSGAHTSRAANRTPAAPPEMPAEVSRPAPQVREPAPQPPVRAPKAPAAAPLTRPDPEPDVSFVKVDRAAPKVISIAEIRSEDAPEAPAKRRHPFRTGYLIYLFVFLALIAAALAVFWYWLDNYELSRPHRTMENYLAAADSAYWHDFLSAKGVEDSFLDTLDLEDTSYFKKVDRYTDAQPAYGIRFGDRNLLITTLKPGRELPFHQTTWDVDTVELVNSGLSVYAPADAVITVRGEPIGPECLKQENAQPLTLGPLEQGRTDIPGLARFELDFIFGNENLTVTDAEGNELPLSQRRGSAYYYAPLTHSFDVDAPAEAVVTVNGVALTAENARVETEPLQDFEDLGDYVDPLPALAHYHVEGLVAEPEVSAEIAAGNLSVTTGDGRCVFTLAPDEVFSNEVNTLVMNAFDAYIAFSGNRGANLNANYSRYNSYLVPGSVAADRAQKALDSLYWVKGRDTALQSQELKALLRYGEDCFTALIDYTLHVDGAVGENSTLFIFVRYNGGWSIVNILNKSTVV